MHNRAKILMLSHESRSLSLSRSRTVSRYALCRSADEMSALRLSYLPLSICNFIHENHGNTYTHTLERLQYLPYNGRIEGHQANCTVHNASENGLCFKAFHKMISLLFCLYVSAIIYISYDCIYTFS